FTVEPSGRYRASADLSLGGGVLAQMKLGPAHASLVASSDQIQVNNFVAEALEGRATGNATIALTKKGASRVSADFNNFDLGGLITALSGRAIPIDSRATGKAELVFTGTDLGTATGSVNAKLSGAAPSGSDLTPVSGDLAITAEHGQFQIQRANLQTAATTLSASGQFSIEQPTSNLRVDVASSDASELQRLLITSGAIPEIEEQFRTYGIEIGGKVAFNGTVNGALKDPIVSGHAEVSCTLKINGIPKSMSGVADLRFGQGRLGGEPLQNLTAHATFSGSTVNVDKVDVNFNAGHLIGSGKFDTETKVFELTASGD